MKKIGELKTKEVYFVICYDEKAKCNPHKIYKKWYDKEWHRRLLVAYEDLYSCVLFIEDYVKRHYQ